MTDINLDKQIKEGLREMIECPVSLDVEKNWAELERRIIEDEQRRRGTKNTARKIVPAFIAVLFLALISSAMYIPEKVTAYKDEIFRMFGYTENGERVIKDRINTPAAEGTYTVVTFETAQSLTVQHLLYPQFIPTKLKDNPVIDVTVGMHPYSLTKMLFKTDSHFLIFNQENLPGERLNNTHIPQNAEFERKKLLNDDIEFIIVKNNNSHRIDWFNQSTHYSIIANVPFDEVVKFIEELK